MRVIVKAVSRAVGALLVVVAGFVAATAMASEPSTPLPAPYAGGNSAANMTHKAAGTWVMTRWVARRTGVLSTLYVRMKTEGSSTCFGRGRPGYALGTTGTALVTTHPVLSDGTPDLALTLTSDQFNPCLRAGLAESAAIPMNLPVTAGQEYATIVRNVDLSPAINWFSSNFLYTSSALFGANGRNERDAAATDAFYGLDPREVVGYSNDGGASWALPGGQYAGGWVPTYIQAYEDGSREGQPYYWAEAVTGVQSMVFPNVPAAWTITHLGVYARAAGTTTLRLLVNGAEMASATVTGSGMLRAPIRPVTPPAGSTVTVRTSGGITLSRMHADGAWKSVMGLGPNFRWYDASNPTGDAVVTVYPLPMYGVTPTVPPPTTTTTTTSTTTTTTPTDTRPPSVRLDEPSSPVDGANVLVSGTEALRATATDDTGVASVAFFAGGTLVATDTTSPYEASFDTTIWPEGTVSSFKAVASDAAGNTAEDVRSVQVVTPPGCKKKRRPPC